MDMIIEALGDAAVKNGIQRKQAYELAAQTMAGSAQLMLDTGLSPGQLKDNVCSPGGTTTKRSSLFRGIRSEICLHKGSRRDSKRLTLTFSLRIVFVRLGKISLQKLI